MTPAEIKSRMIERKLSQPKLAKRFGVSQPTIHYLIHGEMESRKLRVKLARALGVKLSEIPGSNSHKAA